jgi:hypothetical protein
MIALSYGRQYQTSLKMLSDQDADLFLEGHFGIHRGKEALGRFIRSFMEY